MEELKPGLRLGGFEILKGIGRGQMGAVYLARQLSLDRLAALKVLPPAMGADWREMERLRNEARTCAKLVHPNVVEGLEFGQDAVSGRWFFAMEYVPGSNLKKVLDENGPLEESLAARIGRDLADALECAHQKGLIHGDIKPGNILLGSDGRVKLTDFGLARRFRAGISSGGRAGTPNYMSPEQVLGHLDKIDIRSDLYSLGATLFHLVTGQPPFPAPTSQEILLKHLSQPAPKANQLKPEVSPTFSSILSRLLRKRVADRYRSPAALGKALGDFLKTKRISK